MHGSLSAALYGSEECSAGRKKTERSVEVLDFTEIAAADPAAL